MALRTPWSPSVGRSARPTCATSRSWLCSRGYLASPGMPAPATLDLPGWNRRTSGFAAAVWSAVERPDAVERRTA